MLFILFVEGEGTRAACTESYTATEVLQLSGTGIRGHNDHRVAEVHESSVTIRQSSLVEHLQ